MDQDPEGPKTVQYWLHGLVAFRSEYRMAQSGKKYFKKLVTSDSIPVTASLPVRTRQLKSYSPNHGEMPMTAYLGQLGKLKRVLAGLQHQQGLLVASQADQALGLFADKFIISSTYFQHKYIEKAPRGQHYFGHGRNQCCGSALVSMRIQIRLFISMRIRIRLFISMRPGSGYGSRKPNQAGPGGSGS
jgi:hypothetical protein